MLCLLLGTDADLVPTRRCVPMPATMGDLLVGRVAVNDQSLMRTQVAAKATRDPSLENVMVYAAWMELMYRGRSFYRLEEPSFLYRRHEQNISDRIGPDDRQRRLALQQQYRQLVLARGRCTATADFCAAPGDRAGQIDSPALTMPHPRVLTSTVRLHSSIEGAPGWLSSRLPADCQLRILMGLCGTR